MVQALSQSAPQLELNKISRFIGENSTQIQAHVDALENLVEFMLTEDNRHCDPMTRESLKAFRLSSRNMVVDKAYGRKAIRKFMVRQVDHYTIPQDIESTPNIYFCRIRIVNN